MASASPKKPLFCHSHSRSHFSHSRSPAKGALMSDDSHSLTRVHGATYMNATQTETATITNALFFLGKNETHFF
jgi:hypothetical protein